MGFAGLAGFFCWRLNKGQFCPLFYRLVSLKLSFPCHTDFVLSHIKLFFLCHTERSEVSINSKRGYFALNSKCVLNSVDFSPFCKRLKMTNSLSYRLVFPCHTEQSERGNPQRKGNAKFIIFAKTARND